MVQRVTSKLVQYEGQDLHTVIASILDRLTALEQPLATLEEDAEGEGKVDVLDAKSGVHSSLPAS